MIGVIGILMIIPFVGFVIAIINMAKITYICTAPKFFRNQTKKAKLEQRNENLEK